MQLCESQWGWEEQEVQDEEERETPIVLIVLSWFGGGDARTASGSRVRKEPNSLGRWVWIGIILQHYSSHLFLRFRFPFATLFVLFLGTLVLVSHHKRVLDQKNNHIIINSQQTQP